MTVVMEIGSDDDCGDGDLVMMSVVMMEIDINICSSVNNNACLCNLVGCCPVLLLVHGNAERGEQVLR